MEKNKREVSIVRYILIGFLIFALATAISILTRGFLAHSAQKYSLSDVHVDWITNMIEGAVSSIAAAIVLYQLRKSDKVEAHQNDIEEASFILRYNQAFICDANMSEVEHKLEQQMEELEEKGCVQHQIINADNRQKFINYLVYLEGLAPLIFKGVLQLKHIDDLMAYRFFLAMNNKELQEDQIFRYPDYYRGCLKLYAYWKKYRQDRGLPILQEANSVDKWEKYEDYIDCDILIRSLNQNDDLKAVARLIYETDPYIYPTAFGSKRSAKKILSQWISLREGLFGWDNIRIAEKAGKIVGVMVSVDGAKQATVATGIKIEKSESYLHVCDNYFNKIPKIFEKDNDVTYIACICVSEECRGQRIGTLLLKQIIKEKGKQRILLDVLAENERAIKLYEEYGFVKDGEVKEGYSYQSLPPKCYTMIRESENQK